MNKEEYLDIILDKQKIKEMPSKVLHEIYTRMSLEKDRLRAKIEEEKCTIEGCKWHKGMIGCLGGAKELEETMSKEMRKSELNLKKLNSQLRNRNTDEILSSIFSEMHGRESRVLLMELREIDINEIAIVSLSETFKRWQQEIYEKMGKAEREEWQEYKKTGIKDISWREYI